MKPIDTETLLAALKWRYAVKAFDPSRKIDETTWSALEDTLVLSASSFGLQPWKFIVITDQALREQLVPLSWGQRQVVDASHLVVLTVRHPLTPQDVRRHIDRLAELRGVPAEQFASLEKMVNGYITSPSLDPRDWSVRQVYLAFATFMTAAALLGVDTCPMEGIEPAGYDRVLGLEGTGYETVAACPAGYRLASDKYAAMPKVRFPKEQVIERRS